MNWNVLFNLQINLRVEENREKLSAMNDDSGGISFAYSGLLFGIHPRSGGNSLAELSSGGGVQWIKFTLKQHRLDGDDIDTEIRIHMVGSVGCWVGGWAGGRHRHNDSTHSRDESISRVVGAASCCLWDRPTEWVYQAPTSGRQSKKIRKRQQHKRPRVSSLAVI